MKGKKKSPPGTIAENRKARFNYAVEESLECGIELRGTEVKSMREAKISFADCFCEVRSGELWLLHLNITPYAFGGHFNHEGVRPRRLLAHKKEIGRMERRVNERGYTLIPLRFYFKGSRVKVEVGLCKGKKEYDKRESIKQRDIKRDMDRDLARNR